MVQSQILKKIDTNYSHIYRLLHSYRVMYIGFVNGELEILWREYLWVATFPCGEFGGPPPRKF